VVTALAMTGGLTGWATSAAATAATVKDVAAQTADGYGVATTSGAYTFGTGALPTSAAVPGAPAPIAAAAPTPDGGGYWLTSRTGNVYAEGDAVSLGDATGYHLNQPVVSMAATPDGGGYWLLTSGGALYSFGDARFYGSANLYHPAGAIVGMAVTSDGLGYWILSSDGAVYSFGDARFHGSANVYHPAHNIVAMAATADGGGYWMITSNGALFAFGDAAFHGSANVYHPVQPFVGIAATADGSGYWMVTAVGSIFAFGGAPYQGRPNQIGGSAVGIFKLSPTPGSTSTPTPNGTSTAQAAPITTTPLAAPTTTPLAAPTTTTLPAPITTTLPAPTTTVPAEPTTTTIPPTTTTSTPTTASVPAAGPSSPSVIVQMSTIAMDYTPAELAAMIAQICPAGVNPTGQLVLQDVADSSGNLLTSYIDAIEPYLPGGSPNPCFSSVYVGTAEPAAWTGSGSPYIDGVEDPTYVSTWLSASQAVAQQFVADFPNLDIGWYVTYEANLNYLYYPAVLAGYESLLSSDISSLRALRPGAPVMWSPAFWWQYSSYHTNTLGMTGLATNLEALFTSLQSVGGLNQIDLQDFVEGSACWGTANQVTPSDAANWVKFLQGLTGAPTITINTEQYSWDCSNGGILDGNAADVQAREAYYISQGLTLGPAFELRYWLANHEPAATS
jgi:hypothetical protein